MALDYIIVFDGLDGGGVSDAHPGSFDVLSFSWGVSNASSSLGSGAGSGKASFQDLHFTIRYGKGGPALALRCAQGKHFTRATLFGVVPSGDKSVDMEVIDMGECLITSFVLEGNDGAHGATALVSLTYRHIELKAAVQTPDGSFAYESAILE